MRIITTITAQQSLADRLADEPRRSDDLVAHARIRATILYQRLRKHVFGLSMLVLVVAACALRIMLIHLNWPITNSDEGFMDLMALHIVKKGEIPIFFYGQGYMGTIQAYLGSVLFHFFGVSIFTVRLGIVFLFALYLIGTYYLVGLLYTKRFALFCVFLLSFGSGTVMISSEVFANGGYAEIKPFGVVIYILAFLLAFTPSSASISSSPLTRRRLTYAAFGLIAGLAIWSDTLILSCLLTSCLLLWLFCRREILSRTGIYLLVGFMIGIFPIILYNLHAPPGYDSLHALAGSFHPGIPDDVPFFQQIMQVFLISLPMTTGVSPLCQVAEPIHHVNHLSELFSAAPHPQQCMFIQGSWSLGLVLLWMVAALMAVLPLWRQRQRLHMPLKDWSLQERQYAVRQYAQLMLLISAALSFTLYAISAPAAVVPRTTSRYLVCLLLAVPAILWPSWSGFSALSSRAGTFSKHLHAIKIVSFLRILLLLVVLVVYAWGTILIGENIPRAQAAYTSQENLSQDLLHLGITRIYSNYDTCARLIFQSRERIICASLDEHLKPANDRYLLYRAMVKSSRNPAYVFQVDSPYARAFAQAATKPDQRYQQYHYEGYVVCVPVTS